MRFLKPASFLRCDTQQRYAFNLISSRLFEILYQKYARETQVTFFFNNVTFLVNRLSHPIRLGERKRKTKPVSFRSKIAKLVAI